MMNTNFSEKLKLLRKNKGITQQALANAIGEKRSIIANYESNNSTPGFEVLNKLSNFFNVPVGYLTGKTNSLVSEYSFKTLEDYIDILPSQKTLWLKIKNLLLLVKKFMVLTKILKLYSLIHWMKKKKIQEYI